MKKKIILFFYCIFFACVCMSSNNNISNPNDFEVVMRLSEEEIGNQVADSCWVDYGRNMNFVFDDSLFTFGFFGTVIDGPKDDQFFVAFFNDKCQLQKYLQIKEPLNFFPWLLGDEMSSYDSPRISYIDDNWEIMDVTKEYTNKNASIIKNLKERFKEDFIYFHEIYLPENHSYLIFLKGNQYLVKTNSEGKITDLISLKKYHFFDYTETDEYKNTLMTQNKMFLGLKDNQIVVNDFALNMLMFLNLKTGNKKTYNLQEIAKHFKVKGVVSNDESGRTGYDARITAKNVYVILEGKEEIVILRLKN